MKKFAFVLTVAALLFVACGDDDSASAESADDVPEIIIDDESSSGNDGTEDSSSSGKASSSSATDSLQTSDSTITSDSTQTSGSTNASDSTLSSSSLQSSDSLQPGSSSSAVALDLGDTLLYIHKICHEVVDGKHYANVEFRTSIPMDSTKFFELRYAFSSGTSGYYVISEMKNINDVEFENGRNVIRLHLRDLTNHGSNDTKPNFETLVAIFREPNFKDVQYLKVKISAALKKGECQDVEKYYLLDDLQDTSFSTLYRKFDSSNSAVVDTVAEFDDLLKQGCFSSYTNCSSRGRAHYVEELHENIYCDGGFCSEQSVYYPEINPGIPEGMPFEGKFTDPRDGKTYSTVVIGNLEWFAENLNYNDSVANPNIKSHSWCYNDFDPLCDTDGRLYDWAAAINLPEEYNDSLLVKGEWFQGICPEGWHLPTAYDFNNLWVYMYHQVVYDWRNTLMDANIWDSLSVTSYNNKTGFSALPGGHRNVDGTYAGHGEQTYFVVTGKHNTSTTKKDAVYNNAWEARNATSNNFNETCVPMRMGTYVRCVKGKGIKDASRYVQH